MHDSANLVYCMWSVRTYIEGGDKDARDMRDMEMERRLREGRDTETWTGMAGFEKHTKVSTSCIYYTLAELAMY